MGSSYEVRNRGGEGGFVRDVSYEASRMIGDLGIAVLLDKIYD